MKERIFQSVSSKKMLFELGFKRFKLANFLHVTRKAIPMFHGSVSKAMGRTCKFFGNKIVGGTATSIVRMLDSNGLKAS